MSDSVLKDLLKEYEIKRLHAEQLADEKRDQLFKKYPEFEEINSEIAKCGLNLSREKLQAHDNQKIDVLKQELELLKEKKHNFLKSIKMSEDDLLPKYECSICNDTGYIAENNSFTMCSCLKQKLINISYNKSNINKLDFENFSNFDINMYSDEINEEKYHSSVSPRQNILIIKKIVDNFLADFDNPKGKNLLFTGSPGPVSYTHLTLPTIA